VFSFEDQYELAQEITGLTDATSLIRFKRDINRGGTMFLAALGREYNRKSRYTDTEASTQYYQTPQDALRIKGVSIKYNNGYLPCEEVADEQMWTYLNQVLRYSTTPRFFFVRGNDEYGLYPIPSSVVTNGIKLVFEPKHLFLSQADYTTGTITATNGSQTITGSGTTFTSAMVGRYLEATDGTDGNNYRISAYASATSLAIENYWQGTSGIGKTYRISEVMDLPAEFLESPVDYAMYRHYLKKDRRKAADFKALFQASLESARELYGVTTDGQVIYANDSLPADVINMSNNQPLTLS